MKKILLLLVPLFLLGCVGVGQGFDPVNAAKASGQIQSFLKEHPNAKVVALLLTEPQIREKLKEYPDCSGIKAEAMYFVTFDDGQTKAVAFVSESQQKTACVIIQGRGGASVPAASPAGAGPAPAAATSVPATPQGSPLEQRVQQTTEATVSGENLVEFKDERKGFRILKPPTWKAEIVEDGYLVVSKDDNTDVLVWPIQLQGEYRRMTGVGLGNYLIGVIKQKFPDFKVISIHAAPDQSSLQVVATLTEEDTKVKLKVVMTTFVDSKGNGLLSGYEAPESEFDQREPLLRKIAVSFSPIATEQTRAAVGPAPTQTTAGSQGYATVQLTPFSSGDGGFSFNAPSGWKIESLGSCSTKSMAAYDLQNPRRRVFAISTNTLVMPLSQPTAEAAAIDGLPVVSRYVPAYGAVSNVQVAGPKQPYPATQGVPGIVDAAVFDITLTIDGQPAKGQVGTYIYDPSGGYFGGINYISIAGAISEPEAFDSLIGVAYPEQSRGPLGKSVGSFQISQAYANACTASAQSDISRRSGDISRTLSETSDIVTRGYEERSRITDRVAQKWSDTTLGYDRVYNPDRDEVYHVPNNFYENYDINRQKFEYQNMQQLTPEQWNNHAPLDGALNIR